MINEIFLSDILTLKRPTITTTNWEQTKSLTIIDSNVKCRLYNLKKNLNNDNLSQNTVITTAKIITNFSGIVIGDIIEINNYNFLVENVDIKKTNIINHFEIYIKQI
jgi:hypothetical protein